MFEVTLWVNGEIDYSEKLAKLFEAERGLSYALGSRVVWDEAKSIAWSITGENTDITGAWERVQ